jgi:hypothetical protein
MSYPTILFWPEANKPVPQSRVIRICDEYGIKFHNDPLKSYDLHFFWSYTPKSIIPDDLTLRSPNVINRGCWDISKGKVNSIFNDFSIDPETHSGVCVEKCDKQGQHYNHKIIRCPAARKEGYVYQRYIEDKDAGLYVKYRIYYAGGIEYILKQRKKSVFGAGNYAEDYVTHEWVNVRSIFTAKEQMEFDTKCHLFGFDYGDVDFLMEKGKPIIIDVNNVVSHVYFTPWIKEVQDKQFLNFIKRIYDKTGKVLK